MQRRVKNILAVAGVIAVVLGIVGAVPSFLQQQFGLATASVTFIIGGLILLAVAFGD